MTQKTTRPSDNIALLGVIDPAVTAAGTVTTGWIDMSKWGCALATIMVGTLGSGASINASFEQATDSSGTGEKAVTGRAITAMTQAGTNQSDTQAQLELWGEQMDADNDFNFARLTVTVAGATSDVAAIVQGMSPRYGPARDYDADSVGEIV